MTLQEALNEQLGFNQRADAGCAALIAACNPANGHGRIQLPGQNAMRPVEDRDAWRALAYAAGILLSNVRLLLSLQAQTLDGLQRGFVLSDAEAARIADLVAARVKVAPEEPKP